MNPEIILVILLVILIIYTFISGNIRFNDKCVFCSSNKNVKRISRSPITKYLFFMLGLRKFRCVKCNRSFLQLFAFKKGFQKLPIS
jgi:hypothetical protein